MNNSPIFILANPRSGSSVFRLILNSTEKSIFPPECGFIQWLYPKYKNWSSDKIDDFTHDVINSKKMEGWKILESPLNGYLKLHNPTTYSDACYLVYKYYGEVNGKNVKIWGDKNNYYIHHLNTISEIYPNAKYIWLKRNPKDVCASYLKVNEISDNIQYKPKVSNDIEEIFQEIKENYSIIEDFLTNINQNNKCVVNFEDILTKKQNTLNKISEFVNINMNLAINNFDKKMYFDEPKITMTWKGKTTQKLDSNYINTYKLHSKSKEIELHYTKLK